MSESRHRDSASHSLTKRTTPRPWHFCAFVSVIIPIAVAAVFYRLEPVYYPAGQLNGHTLTAPVRNDHMRRGSQVVGEGQLMGPEDLVYDDASHLIYTGCGDGWIKRVTVNESVADSVVENWVNTGGRPLGLALARNGQVIAADLHKGLLRVTREGRVELLTDEVEGSKFKLINGVDVANDGTVYFTEATYKYSFKDVIFELLEGKAHGTFMSYNPTTNNTTMLARNLFFPNGVAVSPDQSHAIFCETTMKRCRKYYIQGPKKGRLENFIYDLPGRPDNIHYDGEGQYWIAISNSLPRSWDIALEYSWIRKGMAMVVKYVGRPHMEKNGGVLAVDLEGKPIAHYYDPQLSLITSGIRIGSHLYCGSLNFPFIMRLDVI